VISRQQREKKEHRLGDVLERKFQDFIPGGECERNLKESRIGVKETESLRVTGLQGLRVKQIKNPETF